MRLIAYTDAASFGGAEQCLANLLAELDSGIEVTVAGTTQTIVERVAAHRQDTQVAVAGRPLTMLRALRGDVCHVNLRTPYACEPALLAAILTPRLRTVAVEHLMLPSNSRAHRSLKRLTSRRLGAHVAVSAATARAVEADAHLAAGSVRVIHNGVPRAATAAPRRLAAGPVVGGVGRVVAQKGFDVLVDALPLLEDVTAVVVGDGPDRAELERRAERLGVRDRLRVTGWTNDVRELLSGLDVFVLPSRYEGLPLSLLEAMAAGRPIVAADVGGVAEAVVADDNGILVPPGDAHALARALRRVLGDPPLRERLGSRAYDTWRTRFDVRRMAAAYEAVYRGP